MCSTSFCNPAQTRGSAKLWRLASITRQNRRFLDLQKWFSSNLVAHSRAPRSPKRLGLQHSRRRRRGGIVAEVPHGENLHLGDRAASQIRPGQSSRSARRSRWSAAHASFDDAILALPAACAASSRATAILGQHRKYSRNLWKSRVCVRVVGFPELSKPRQCRSPLVGHALAATSSEAVTRPLMPLKHPPATRSAPGRATVPTPAYAPKTPQPKQLSWRRTRKASRFQMGNTPRERKVGPRS